ncbi:MAG: cation-translocating P-type ATPase [Myxococcales bacterium]|nr:cation-translocating P-type ATPase [Myxococcales bacterium]
MRNPAEPGGAAPPPHRAAAAAVAAALGVDPRHGLDDAEARRRLGLYGPNELAAAAPTPAWRLLLAQFENGLVLLLLFAAAVSGALWIYDPDTALPYEAITIFAVVALNAGMSWLQQARAEQAVAALRRLAAANATVLRGGERRRLPAREVVVGDVILVEAGDAVPADARLLQEAVLQTAEAALTGESMPVDKDTAPLAGDAAIGERRNMVYGGTAVTCGHGRAVVVATGMATEIGRIAGLLHAAPTAATPLETELDRIGRLLGVAVVAIAIVISATIIVAGRVRGVAALVDVLVLGVALAVAAVPEGLPAVVTAVLALGVQRLARRNAIVRHLAAVETLGSTNVIAADKTGTLTRNEMTVRVIVTASGRVELAGVGYEPEGDVRVAGGAALEGPLRSEVRRALAAADRAANAVLQRRDGRWVVEGDPTEAALVVAARKIGLVAEDLDARFARVGEVPFSSERKLMSTLHTDGGRGEQVLVFTKGAPDVLLARCTRELVGEEERPLTAARRALFGRVNDGLAAEALRTLAVAYRAIPRPAFPLADVDERIERELVFLALFGMADPPRTEAKAAVARTQRAGIRPVMITGDHPTTAVAVARELGIAVGGRVVTGAEIDRWSDDALAAAAGEVAVYARVDPEHKLRIVRALQRCGAIVAMTGDGVNDAPALETADIGVAMGLAGTDVAREAADIVLADDDFATIVAAVEEGRAIFANLRKFLRFLLATNIGEVLVMFFGVVGARGLGLDAATGGELLLPLLATQLLWINLVTDSAPAFALGLDPPDPALMDAPPRPRGEPIVTSAMWLGIVCDGVVVAAGTLLVLDACLPGGLIAGAGAMPYARTMAFTTLVLFSFGAVFNARSDTRSAFAGLFVNPWLWGALGLALAAQAAVVYLPVLQRAFATVPLAVGDWAACAAVASTVLWLSEAQKLVRRTWRRCGDRGRAGRGGAAT